MRKRARCKSRQAVVSQNLSALWQALHESVLTPSGDPVNVVVLRFLGQQVIAACCRAALEWASVGGRRVAFCVDDNTPPYAPLERVAPAFVQTMRLGREGRSDVLERATLLQSFCKATLLLCIYSRLGGLSRHLQDTVLGLRWVRFRQCALKPTDVAMLLANSPQLEAAVFLNENLRDVSSAIADSSGLGLKLRAIDFTECELTAVDATALFAMLPHLQYVHLQCMSLTGIRIPMCPALESLGVTDCQLNRRDAIGIAKQCPNLRALNLCGNDLARHDVVEEERESWPSMSVLRVGDFRFCELSELDEATLRHRAPSDAILVFHANLGTLTAEVDSAVATEAARRAEAFGLLPLCGFSAPSRRHIVFEDSSSDSE